MVNLQQLDICSLIGLAWKLVKQTFFKTLPVVLIPILGLTIFNVSLTILQQYNTLTSLPTSTVIMLKGIALLAGLVSGLLATLFWVVSFAVLARFYFLSITQSANPSFASCLQYVRRHWWMLLLYLIVMTLVMIVVLALEAFIGFSLFFSLSWILSTVSIALSHYMPSLMTLVFFVVVGFLVLLLFVMVVSVQTMLGLFPVLSFATATGNASQWISHVKNSSALIFKNVFQVTLFLVLFSVVTFFMNLAFMFPVWVWVGFEVARTGVGGAQHFMLPLHVQIVTGITTTLLQLIQLPFQTAALTLFFYRCKIRYEGLDLQEWLWRLSSSRVNQ
jgi:hypothetical protein